MNPDPLTELWNSDANRPEPDEGTELAARFVARLRSRRRFQAWWLGWTVLALTSVTWLAIRQIVVRNEQNTTALLVMAPLLVFPWVAALHFLRTFRRETGLPAVSEVSIREALDALRVSNDSSRRRSTVVGALLAAMTPLIALAVLQLHAAGKASTDQAWSMALVFGVSLSLGVAGLAWHVRRRLLPERRRIEALMRDLDGVSSD